MEKGKNNSFKNILKAVCTKETLGLVLIVLSVLSLVCLITRELIFFNLGLHVSNFLFGIFGYFSFIVELLLITVGYMFLTGKKFDFKKRGIKCAVAVFLLSFCLMHAISARNFDFSGYGKYLSQCYNSGSGGFQTATAGGLFFGLVMYWFSALITNIGVYVVFPLAILATVFLFVRSFVPESSNVRVKKDDFSMKVGKINIEGYKAYPLPSEQFKFPSYDENDRAMQTLYIRTDDFQLKSKRDKQPLLIKLMRNPNGTMIHAETSLTYADSKQFTLPEEKNEETAKPENIITKSVLSPSKIDAADFISNRPSATRLSVSSEIRRRPLENNINEDRDSDSTETRARNFESRYASIPEEPVSVNLNDVTVGDVRDFNGDSEEQSDYVPRGIFDGITERRQSRSEKSDDLPKSNIPDFTRLFVADKNDVEEHSESDFSVSQNDFTIDDDLFTRANTISERRSHLVVEPVDNAQPDDYSENNSEKDSDRDSGEFQLADMDRRSRAVSFAERVVSEPVINRAEVKDTPKVYEKKSGPRCTSPFDCVYNAPPVTLLKDPVKVEDFIDHQQVIKTIEDFFEWYGIPGVKVATYISGPVITRYEIEVPRGVKMSAILSCSDDLQRTLRAVHDIRISIIPGSDKLGIEVPRDKREIVGLKDIIESPEYNAPREDSVPYFALGKDLIGNPIIDSIANGPHYLMAGTTGSGKSVCLNALLISMLYRYGPEELKLVLIDPKMVTFSKYSHLPHLLIDEIIYDNKRAMAMFDWLITEMDDRYLALRDFGFEKISEYNEYARANNLERLPSILIVIDEYAELVSSYKKEVEAKLQRLAQKARAAGMYIILATQKPVKEVLTTVVKSNLKGRIALKVSNRTDSGVILDEIGAEKLLGHGDMLYQAEGTNNARYQSPFVTGPETKAILDYIIEHNSATFDDSIVNDIETSLKADEEEETTETPSSVVPNIKLGPGGSNDMYFPYALHIAIEEKEISASRLQILLNVGFQRASKLMNALESKGYIERPSAGSTSKKRRVLVGKETFEELYGDFDSYGK